MYTFYWEISVGSSWILFELDVQILNSRIKERFGSRVYHVDFLICWTIKSQGFGTEFDKHHLSCNIFESENDLCTYKSLYNGKSEGLDNKLRLFTCLLKRDWSSKLIGGSTWSQTNKLWKIRVSFSTEPDEYIFQFCSNVVFAPLLSDKQEDVSTRDIQGDNSCLSLHALHTLFLLFQATESMWSAEFLWILVLNGAANDSDEKSIGVLKHPVKEITLFVLPPSAAFLLADKF